MRSKCFEENTVVLPMTVLEELDNMKKEEGRKRCQCTQSDSDFGRTQRKRKFAGRGAYGMGRDSACRKKITGTLNCLRIFRNINLIIAF